MDEAEDALDFSIRGVPLKSYAPSAEQGTPHFHAKIIKKRLMHERPVHLNVVYKTRTLR